MAERFAQCERKCFAFRLSYCSDYFVGGFANKELYEENCQQCKYKIKCQTVHTWEYSKYVLQTFLSTWQNILFLSKGVIIFGVEKISPL